MTDRKSDEKTFVTNAHSSEDVAYKKARPHEGLEPYLVIMSGSEKGKKILLLSNVTTIGRSSRNHIQIKDPLVSVHHAEIRWEEKEITLVDLKSTNGSFVNGSRVESKKLYHGVRLWFGKTELMLFLPLES